MEEPTTYVGASSRHAFCTNYKFKENCPLQMFKTDEVYPQFDWLDIKNCSGILDENSFKNLPNLEILNIDKSDLTIKENSFCSINKLKSLEIRKSSVTPLSQDTFNGCSQLDSLRFIQPINEFKSTDNVFGGLKNLTNLTLQKVSELSLTKKTFVGLKNLRYLFITGCKISDVDFGMFEDLPKLESLYFTGNTRGQLHTDIFKQLKALKVLGLHSNKADTSNIDYQEFQNLPALETVSFPEESIRKMDFKQFKNLQRVQLVIGKATVETMEFLKNQNVEVEWTVDSDSIQEPDLSDPNIQICA